MRDEQSPGAARPTLHGPSLIINLLLFVSPLYMLQIYDRVIPSRSETTLAGITLIAAFGLAVYVVLDMLRARLLVRGGMVFDQEIATPIFDAAHRGTLLSRNVPSRSALAREAMMAASVAK